MVAVSDSSTAKSRDARSARAPGATAGPSDRPASANVCSSASRNGAWLVTRIRKPGAAARSSGEDRRGVQHVLEVVEHEQQLAARERTGEQGCAVDPTAAAIAPATLS